MTPDELSLYCDALGEARPRMDVHPRYMTFAASQLAAASALLDDFPADCNAGDQVALAVKCVTIALEQLIEGARQ